MQVDVRSHATAVAMIDPGPPLRSNRWITLVVTVSCPAEGFFPVGGLASAAEGSSHGPWDEPGEAFSGALEHNLASLAVGRERHVLDGKMVVGHCLCRTRAARQRRAVPSMCGSASTWDHQPWRAGAHPAGPR